MPLKIAGAILCFNRPEYLEKVIKSLETANYSDKMPWYIFQDGAVNRRSGRIYATTAQLESVAKVIKDSSLPIREFYQNKYNYSIPTLKKEAHHLFEDYDLIFFFEDDLVVGKNYLTLLKKLYKQFPNSIGMMNKHPSKLKGHSIVRRCPTSRLWGYYMSKDVYNKIRDDFNFFHNRIMNVDYNNRHRVHNLREIMKTPHLSQDVTITNACKNNNILKLWPDVSRGLYIGRSGAIAHRDDEIWFRKGFDKQHNKITFPEDSKIKEFVLK
jgi:hypothetical protein